MKQVLFRQSLRFMRVFILLWGVAVTATCAMVIPVFPWALIGVLVGCFAIRHALRLGIVLHFDSHELVLNSLTGTKRFPTESIHHVRVTQNNVFNWDDKDVLFFMPGRLNYYYTYSTKENGVVETINDLGIPKKSLFFCSEIKK